MNDHTDTPAYADPAIAFGIRVDAYTNQIIDDLQDDDDRFGFIAAIIANLAAYLAGEVE